MDGQFQLSKEMYLELIEQTPIEVIFGITLFIILLDIRESISQRKPLAPL